MNTTDFTRLSALPTASLNSFTSSQYDLYLVDDSVRFIEAKLDQSGWFNDVTHRELQDISNILEPLSPSQTNAVISNLSDKTLNTWADEISSNGLFGTGGLSADERTDLFNNLASDLEPAQFARFYNAFDKNSIQSEILTSANEHMSQDKIITATNYQLITLPVGNSQNRLQDAITVQNRVQDASDMAGLSGDVYLNNNASNPTMLPANTRRLNPDQIPASFGITRNDLIDTESGFHAAIYETTNNGDKQYIIAFRGTENFFGSDGATTVISNFMIAQQFEMAEKLVGKLIGVHGSDTIKVTGHSLGGSLANYAALSHGVTSVTFNGKGTTLPERMSTGDLFGIKAQQLITNYQVKGEALTGVQEEIHLFPETPGNRIKIPAIKPDGTPGNFIRDILVEISLYSIPIIGPSLADKHDISGPIDRHGMDYVERGIVKVLENSSQTLLDALFDSYK